MKTSCCLRALLISLLAVGWSPSVKAAVVNPVQTGTVTMSALTQPVAITAVNPAKAFVICQFMPPNGSQDSDRVTCELNSATTLTVTIGVADPGVIVRWYVVEFLSGVTVQRGLVPATTFDPATATFPVTLATAVDLTKTFALISTVTSSTSRNRDEEFTPTAQLTTGTNLQLTRSRTGISLAVAWQVIQIESASVQSGFLNMAQGNTTATATLNPPVDTARTFMVFTANGGSAINGVESRYQTTGVITNSTTLTFARAVSGGGGNDVNIAWFAVRMTDGTTVQGGTNTTPNTTTGTMNAAITAIAIPRSVPILSTSGDPARTNNNDLDDTSWAAAFTSTTNLQLTKSAGANNASNATVAWQVVQFNNAPNLVDGDGREVFP